MDVFLKTPFFEKVVQSLTHVLKESSPRELKRVISRISAGLRRAVAPNIIIFSLDFARAFGGLAACGYHQTRFPTPNLLLMAA